ncbi:DNA-binding transcriptional LysR family regulator [Sphingomonas zeicaulis]|uniref:LysR family transcriptional regulator n=1 Tax=Sphingomonas zeicaulis TaxID=1632740 RepID=UPI003D195D35
MNQRIDWEDQRAFLAVLDGGSLSAAARQLGVAQPTVRARIEALERALGTTLFTRSVRGLTPTAQARTLGAAARAMAHASDAFARLASAAADVPAGVVRLGVSEFVGVAVLPAMLAHLRRSHPDLRIELVLSNSAADLLEQEVDVAVRMHPPRQEALVAAKVPSIPLGLFAHRDYLARRGVPESLADLGVHDMIGPDCVPADLAIVAQVFPDLDRSRFAIRTDSHPAQFAAIRAGLGIGVAQRPVALADPSLRAVLPDLVVATLDTWIVTHENLRALPRVAALFDHLVAAFREYGA